MNNQSPAKSWPDENIIPLPTTLVTNSNFQKPPPLVRSLMDLTPASSDDRNTLLGNRFLCRGAGALFVGHSGIGKSTAVIQMGINFAIGRPGFGITPGWPLKIVYVQAENDEGDLCEMRNGVLDNLDELCDEERKSLRKNFICAFEAGRSGPEFISQTLHPLLKEHSPDLVIIDPALSYLGADANDQRAVGGFLRNLLNPLLQEYRCGALIVHHTPKPTGQRDAKNKVTTDYAYAGAGSAEWANWARAVLVLKAKDDNGLRELRIGKRFRLGWKDADGNPTPTRLLQQSPEGSGLFYTELSPRQAMMMSRTSSPLQKVLGSINILPPPGESISQDLLVSRLTGTATGVQICGRDKATKEVIPLLIEQGYLERNLLPRPGKRPEIQFKRTTKEVVGGAVSFDPAIR